MTDDADQARDVLEEVLTNHRADVPAIPQRRHLAQQVTRTLAHAEDHASAARAAYDEVSERAQPYLEAARLAEDERREAKLALRRAETEAARATPLAS